MVELARDHLGAVRGDLVIDWQVATCGDDLVLVLSHTHGGAGRSPSGSTGCSAAGKRQQPTMGCRDKEARACTSHSFGVVLPAAGQTERLPVVGDLAERRPLPAVQRPDGRPAQVGVDHPPDPEPPGRLGDL
jgi:hypothetical protein